MKILWLIIRETLLHPFSDSTINRKTLKVTRRK